MNQTQVVQAYIQNIFDQIDNPLTRHAAFRHTYGVAQNCALLAHQRGLDPELSTVMGLLHDLYSFQTGISTLHAPNGSEMVRVLLKKDFKDLFSAEEQLLIKSAIYHHSDKDLVHDEYDELLKDADLLQLYLTNPVLDSRYKKRISKIAAELNLAPVTSFSHTPSVPYTFQRTDIANIAQDLAQKKIIGSKDDTDFMNIIRHYPESSAFDELRHAWCAAFVYYCCIKAGLELPIRLPCHGMELANCRFACVIAWFEWATHNEFIHKENTSFIPERGDIVIYNQIIPSQNKPENSLWCDHMGIVLSATYDSLIVAEGNVDNQNCSGIATRKRDQTIGYYVRIPNDYEYTDWKIDYKTGKIRINQYNLIQIKN